MSTDLNVAKKVVHDKLEAEIKSAAAKLETLKARAEAAKADAEIKAIANLLPKKYAIQQKLLQLKTSASDKWDHMKTEIEAQIADFEKSVKGIESKAKAAKA